MIYHRDCLEAMKEMPDKAFELAIVDPPYNVGANDGTFGRRGGDGYSKTKKYAPTPIRTDLKKYSNADEIPSSDYFKELFRISKNQIIWGANYYPQYLNHSGWIVWYKHMTGPLSDAELAYQSFNKVVKVFDFQWSGFVKQVGSFENKDRKTIHPNQKPVALYEWLLKNYAKLGDKILDTHLGSGSSAIAAYNMGYDFTGYEIDAEYFQAAKERLDRHMKQERLFEPQQINNVQPLFAGLDL